MNRRQQTIQRIDQARILLLGSPDGITPSELGKALGINRTNAAKLMRDIGAVHVEGSRGKYTLIPDSLYRNYMHIIQMRIEYELKNS